MTASLLLFLGVMVAASQTKRFLPEPIRICSSVPVWVLIGNGAVLLVTGIALACHCQPAAALWVVATAAGVAAVLLTSKNEIRSIVTYRAIPVCDSPGTGFTKRGTSNGQLVDTRDPIVLWISDTELDAIPALTPALRAWIKQFKVGPSGLYSLPSEDATMRNLDSLGLFTFLVQPRNHPLLRFLSVASAPHPGTHASAAVPSPASTPSFAGSAASPNNAAVASTPAPGARAFAGPTKVALKLPAPAPAAPVVPAPAMGPATGALPVGDPPAATVNLVMPDVLPAAPNDSASVSSPAQGVQVPAGATVPTKPKSKRMKKKTTVDAKSTQAILIDVEEGG